MNMKHKDIENTTEEIKETKTEEVVEETVVNDNTKKLEDKINKLTETLKQEVEKSMRIQAEMVNFKRRKEDEVITFKKYANEDILKSLLNIVDNFERALMLETEENKEFLKGFNMIYTNILNILKDNEVVEIEALNQEFDPSVHQAVLTDKVEGVDEGIVIEVLQKGYKYKDRVLRPAMVKVSE